MRESPKIMKATIFNLLRKNNIGEYTAANIEECEVFAHALPIQS
jgi:hypothetical protein